MLRRNSWWIRLRRAWFLRRCRRDWCNGTPRSAKLCTHWKATMENDSRQFRAWIALGSNLGDCEATLRSAVRALQQLGKVIAVSSVWETEPVGLAEQPKFLNAAVALETSLDAAELLQQLLQIELAHGRDRSSAMRNGPRTLDLDLLLMESAG